MAREAIVAAMAKEAKEAIEAEEQSPISIPDAARKWLGKHGSDKNGSDR